MAPSPPLAVMLALTVRSSAAVLPSAASVISPPPLSSTGEFTVSGLEAVTTISPPAAWLVTPLSESTFVMNKAPVLSIRMSPDVVLIAARLVTVVSRALPEPIPAAARKATEPAVMSMPPPASVTPPLIAVTRTRPGVFKLLTAAFCPAVTLIVLDDWMPLPPTCTVPPVDVTETAPEPPLLLIPPAAIDTLPLAESATVPVVTKLPLTPIVSTSLSPPIVTLPAPALNEPVTFTASVLPPPLTNKFAPKAASALASEIVSAPEPPLRVSEPLGTANVVFSNVLPVSCMLPAVAWLASVASGLPPAGRLKMMSVALPLLVSGSSPV